MTLLCVSRVLEVVSCCGGSVVASVITCGAGGGRQPGSPAARAVEAVEPTALDDRLVDGRACSAGAGSAEQGSREGPGAAGGWAA